MLSESSEKGPWDSEEMKVVIETKDFKSVLTFEAFLHDIEVFLDNFSGHELELKLKTSMTVKEK
jgi:hypothetical protein